MRLLNSSLSLLCALVFAGTSAMIAGWSLGFSVDTVWVRVCAYALLVCLAAHALTELAQLPRQLQAWRQRRRIRPRPAAYRQLHWRTTLQHIAGLLALGLIVWHLCCFPIGAPTHGSYFAGAPAALDFALQGLTLALLGTHLAIGLPQAAMGLGLLRRPGSFKAWQIAGCALAGAPVAWSVFALVCHYFY